MALTYTDGSAKLYLDGGLDKEDTTAIGFLDNSTNRSTYIGCAGSGGYWFHGIIDEFRIYNTTLSEADIRFIYEGKEDSVDNEPPSIP